MCASGSRSPNSELCGLVQSVRGAASAKGWGIKRPTPFCALGIRPARLCAGPFIKGRAALCRRCGNPFFSVLFLTVWLWPGALSPPAAIEKGQPVVWLPLNIWHGFLIKGQLVSCFVTCVNVSCIWYWCCSPFTPVVFNSKNNPFCRSSICALEIMSPAIFPIGPEISRPVPVLSAAPLDNRIFCSLPDTA